MRVWQPTPVFLPGESPWTEESGRLQSVQFQRVRCDQSDLTYTYSLNSDQQFSILSALEPPVPRPHPGPIKSKSLGMSFRMTSCQNSSGESKV